MFWKAISPVSVGRVKTTWKYGTGNNSACRCASHSARASPGHLGQWQIRQVMGVAHYLPYVQIH
nr:hypothetical protein [Bradyrhizobium canariense]